MKAYAQFIDKNGTTYRLNTLLQFGNSWKHIGNIVLANPGSSNIIDKISDEVDDKISNFYKQFDNRIYYKNNYFECSVDQTMLRVEKIFDGSYINNEEKLKLNGVVQLFNSFNIKNQNLEEAIKSLPLDNELLYSIGIEKYFNDKPTYFGFSKTVINNNRLNPIVRNIFDNSSDKIKSIYKKDFYDNSFYHPTYINRAYNQKHFQKYKDEVLKPLKKLMEYK
jgi:hypothetical protein